MSPNTSHFLHLTRKRYRKQHKLLERLYERDSFLVQPNQVVKNRKLIKYWSKRNSLFSKFNERPIYLTEELWYSVTPEKIAKFVAKFARVCLPNAKKVLDVFCGAGGNTIQLALEFERVYGVDWSMEHLYCTHRNAEAYGVSDNIWLKYGSWEIIAKKGRFNKIGIDFLFGSPPWGGPQYLRESTYDLEKLLQPMGITQMLQSMISITPNIMLFLPRNSNLEQVSSATRQVFGVRGQCRVVYVKEDGFLKGILCMWGDALVKAGGEEEEPDEENTCKKKDTKHDVDYSLDG
ncbi:related to Trimethylguanosine synthase [Zygosaccharomyces bailii]|nr:related to Trimethylguanosine synthase [Zygosaccharomyces bailii]